MRQATLCISVLVAICACGQFARSETLQVQIYSADFAQVYVIAGNRVISKSKWYQPQKDEEKEPLVVNLTCKLPCTVRVRWNNGTYETFGPITVDDAFDAEGRLGLAIKPVWESRTKEYAKDVWDKQQRRWVRRIFTKEYPVKKHVPEFYDIELKRQHRRIDPEIDYPTAAPSA